MTDEIQAREFPRVARANLAPWADHREYNDDTFLSAIARYRDTIRAVDPGAPVGISGTQMPSAWGGFDFWKIGNTIGWIEHYDCNGSREAIRSFLPRRYPAIAAMPYTTAGEGLCRMWYLALHGDSGGLVWPYRGNDTGKTLLLDVKDGALALTPLGENLKAIFREARCGVPCLLRRAEPMLDPVGVLYSQASLRADWMFEVKRDGKTWCNRYSSYEGGHNYAAAGREGLYKLIEDLGLQYACLSGAQVARGELVKRGLRLLIVPRGLALSKAEIEGLRAYVEQGGVLVTDLMAGRMNENCRVWPDSPGPLDVLLGVKRAPFAFEEETKDEGDKGGFGRPVEITMQSDFGGLKAGERLFFQGFQEPGLQAGAAKALASAPGGPALLAQPHGKGLAYTLNFDLPNYLAQRGASDAEKATQPARRLLAALLQKAGIEPVVKVRAKGADVHPMGWETFRFSMGEAEFYAIHVNGSVRINWEDLSDAGAGVAAAQGLEFTVQLPRKGFVTEMRTGKSFGFTDRVEVRTAKDQPVLLCLLPYQVRSLAIERGADRIADGKLSLSLAVDAGEANARRLDHVVHAELVNSADEVVPESVVNLPLSRGSYRGALDMSFVPGDGPWTLRLRDVASGKTVWKKVSR
jgi:hypothetical protein